jgi:hypothetical protein
MEDKSMKKNVKKTLKVKKVKRANLIHALGKNVTQPDDKGTYTDNLFGC